MLAQADALRNPPVDDESNESPADGKFAHDPLIESIRALQLAMNPPEWMVQLMKVERGDAKWDDFSFEERTCRGWLWPYLLQLDSMPRLIGDPEDGSEFVFEKSGVPAHMRGGSGRWGWWMVACELGRLPKADIPKINFFGMHEPQTMRMLEKCLDANWNYRLPDFLDWILWGFGEGKERPKIDAKTNEKWYRTFNLGLMITNPTDYWGYLYSETKGRGSWNRSGFYPTPQHVCKLMAMMVYSDFEKEQKAGFDSRLQSVCEPCCGTGRMLMEASNYSVNLQGMDIDYVCVAATKVNGYLYMPWLVRPALWVGKLAAEQGGGDQAESMEDQTTEGIAARIIKEINPEHEIEYEAEQKSGVHRFKIKSGPAKRTKFKVKDLNVVEFRKQYEKAVKKAMRAKMKHEQQEQLSMFG